ncbi:MAG: allantoinase AllB, partial [Pseudoclavibacter sp.]
WDSPDAAGGGGASGTGAGARIVAVDAFDSEADAVLPDDLVLLPGLVDSHVHLNEPGRTEWEGFETGTAAALAGGIATVFDMPLNSIPVTTTPQALAAKRAAAAGGPEVKLATDLGYWGGAVPENLGHLAELHAAGVVGFKCFLSPSGIDEFGHLDAPQLRAAMREIAEFDGVLIVHAEDPAHLGADGPRGRDYTDFLASRPPASERAAIDEVIDAARETGARAHIVHVSDGGSLDAVRRAKSDGVRLTIETCPHYLTLAAEHVPDGDGAFKCCPPIRGEANRDLLWQGVADGTIDAIVSDHSPATRDLKLRDDGDFGLAWGGIAGVQTGLAAVWTEARVRGVALERIVRLMTAGPASIALGPVGGVREGGVGEGRVVADAADESADGSAADWRIPATGRPGEIAPGAPAHLTVFDPDESWRVEAGRLEYRNAVTPWHGCELTGRVRATYVRGRLAYTPERGIVARLGREILLDRALVAATAVATEVRTPTPTPWS